MNLNDLKTFGFLFETLCVRDLRVFADALGGGVYHYRDRDGQECDAVIHLRNGKYGLIEIKLGGDKLIEEGAKSLKAMAAKIDIEKMNVPSFLMVLTGTGDYAYQRPDGVCVVPIGCRSQISKGPYFKDGSTNTGVPASMPPDYPTHRLPKFNVKLQ